jgi:hypothetical protein
MNEITFDSIKKSQDGRRIDLIVRLDGRSYPLYFQSDSMELAAFPESFVAAAILPAMKARVPVIRVDAGLSSIFVKSVGEIQRVFQSWKPTYGAVEIKSKTRPPFVRNRTGKTGLFFSGGIDSYYSFLTQRDEIDTLVYLDGFDVPLKYTELRKRLRHNIQRISTLFDFPITTLETNLREFEESFLSWSFAHGAALASVSYLLAEYFSTLNISPNGNPALTTPFGSHPDLDPHWSSDILITAPIPNDINKIEKLRYISQFDPVCDTLRVCYKFPDTGINCGVCNKCLRSMVYLQTVGAYEEFKGGFNKPLDVRVLAGFHQITAENVDLLYKASKTLEENGTYPETARALRKILYPNPRLVRIKKRLRRLLKPLFMRKQ